MPLFSAYRFRIRRFRNSKGLTNRVDKAFLKLVLASSIALLSLPGVALKAGIPDTLPALTTDEHRQLHAAPNFGAFKQMMDCMEETLQVPVDWYSIDTTRLIYEVTQGNLDFIYPMGRTAERDATMQASEYFRRTRDLWVFIDEFKDHDLSSPVIVAKRGSPQQSYLESQPTMQFELIDSYEAMFKMLIAKRADMVAVPEEVLNAIKGSFPGTKFQSKELLVRDVVMYMPPDISAEKLESYNAAIRVCRVLD